MATSSISRVRPRSTRFQRDWKAFLARLRRWRMRLRRARQRFGTAPAWVRVIAITSAVLVAVSAANIVYQVARKPTEMLLPLSGVLNKKPVETWRQYGPLFRQHATAVVTPELLAALAQAEGTGNPVARTYWRWRLSWNPFEIYRPASSAVGMYQMTDPAFAEARRYCIRDHAVSEEGCWFTGLYTRVLPSHAVELASIYLGRNVASVLARQPKVNASARQKQELAAVIHLCGPGAANSFVRRGFRLKPGEQCGDHDVATYLARIGALQRVFQGFAVSG